jgi:hypothetical protein
MSAENTFTLEGLEKAVAAEDWEYFEASVDELFRFARSRGNAVVLDKTEQIATRIAALLSAYLVARKNIPTATVVKFVQMGNQFRQLYGASGFGSPVYLQRILGNVGAEGTYRFQDRAAIARFALVMTLGTFNQPRFELLRKNLSQTYFSKLLVSLLGDTCMFDENFEDWRNHLLENHQLLEVDQPDPVDLQLGNLLWMHSSYATTPRKHEVKRTLVRNFRKWVAANCRHPLGDPVSRPQRQVPRLLVAMEHMSESHAMYRCYGPSIMQLGERFELV